MYSVVKLNKNRHHKCLHFDDLEEAVLEFNHLTIKNKGNKNTIVCLATFADKLTKVKKKTNKKQKKKRQDDTHMLYRVYFPSLPGMIKLVFPNIPDKKEPALYCTLLNNLDKAVCFFDKITDKYKNIPDSLICLCNAFDEDYSLFKFDGSDVPIFEERDKGFYKIEKNNKNNKRGETC